VGFHQTIVPYPADGQRAVTLHRSFVDHVVTEYGVARLRGRTVRERTKDTDRDCRAFLPRGTYGARPEKARFYLLTEEGIRPPSIDSPPRAFYSVAPAEGTSVDKFFRRLNSVRLAIVLVAYLAATCVLATLIPQG
jgi:hypothetical protein